MSLRELRTSKKVEMGRRRGSATDRRHRSKAWIGGLGRLGSSTKWVSWWVGEVELWWVGEVELWWVGEIEDRVRPTVARQIGESLRE